MSLDKCTFEDATHGLFPNNYAYPIVEKYGDTIVFNLGGSRRFLVDKPTREILGITLCLTAEQYKDFEFANVVEA